MRPLPIPDEWLDPEAVQRRGVGGWMGEQQMQPSPQVEDAPAQSLGWMQQPGRSFLDVLAESIASTPAPRPRSFGEGLVTGVARGFASGRGRDMAEREKVQQGLRERQATNNARAIKANDDAAARRTADLDKQRAERRAAAGKLYERAEAIRYEKPNQQQTERNAMRFQNLSTRAADMHRAKADIAMKRLGTSDPAMLAALDAKEATIDRDLAPVMEQRAALMVDMPRPVSGTSRAFDAHGTAVDAISPRAQRIADAIKRGDLAPDYIRSMPSRDPDRSGVMDALAQQGVDAVSLGNDIVAEKKFWQTQNDTKRVSMRALLGTIKHSIPYTRQLITELRSKVPDFSLSGVNKVQLIAVANGRGPNAILARNLIAQISDLGAEIGSLYMGGNSNTDESFRVAQQNINSSWTEEQILAALDQIEANASFRERAMQGIRAETPTSGAQREATPDQKGRPPLQSFDRR